MRLFRWIAASGFRLTMTIALLVFVYHVASELRVLFGGPLDFHQRLELTALDVKFAARGSRPPATWRVAVAAVDEKAIQEFGPLPWSRAIHARLVRKLTEMGAKSIAFDMTFDHPSSSPAEEAASTLREKVNAAGLLDAASGLTRSADAAERIASELTRAVVRPQKTKTLIGVHAAELREIVADTRRAKSAVEAFEREMGAPVEGSSPDLQLVNAIRESGRVVIGVINLSKMEAESIGASGKSLSSALERVRSSTIAELISNGPDGVEIVHPGSRELFDGGLYRRFFGVQAPFDQLARATPYFGTINALPDDDGVYRRIPLVSAVKGAGVLLPTLALKAVEVARAPDEIQVIGTPDDPSPEAVRIGNLRIDTELEAAIALHWYGGFSPGEMPIHSISDILRGSVPAPEIDGRVIFVGATAAGTHDQRVTPMERAVPGVYIHATLAQNILDGLHMARPRHVIAIELLLFLVIGLVSGLVITRVNALGQVASAGGIALAWIAVDELLLFPHGLIVHTVLPIFQIFLTLLGVALWRFLVEQRERQKTKQAFGRYLAPKVMEQVLAHPEVHLRLGGRRYDATVLFSDIRGFTTISEALTPEELGTLLNRYMTPMTDIVFEFGGTLDKYIGDAVMAFWGAPFEQPNHALLACRAALKMLDKVGELNKEFEAAGLPSIAIGIGLSSGPMTIGNMGSDDHFAYTALGDRVNLGARLEGQTKEYGVDVILSDATYEHVKGEMLCRELGALRVKGKYEPVRIYQLIGDIRECQARRSFVEAFHEGLECFRSRRWIEAIEHFTRARALSGAAGDKCADDYIGWCMEHAESPPPPGWDGVRIATSK